MKGSCWDASSGGELSRKKLPEWAYGVGAGDWRTISNPPGRRRRRVGWEGVGVRGVRGDEGSVLGMRFRREDRKVGRWDSFFVEGLSLGHGLIVGSLAERGGVSASL